MSNPAPDDTAALLQAAEARMAGLQAELEEMGKRTRELYQAWKAADMAQERKGMEWREARAKARNLAEQLRRDQAR